MPTATNHRPGDTMKKSDTPRDRFPLTDKGARQGVLHLRRVIGEEQARQARVAAKIERLSADNQARAEHIAGCRRHLAELEAVLAAGPNHATRRAQQ